MHRCARLHSLEHRKVKEMVSSSVILALYTVLVIIITVPIMVALLMKVKGKVKLAPFLLGLVVYFTFGVVCVAFINILFVNEGRPTAALINGNIVVNSLYFAVVIGLLEELGVYIAFKKILVSYDEKSSAIMYSLGHAGLEAFLVSGPALFVYITCATALNELGVQGFKEQWADMQTVDIDKIADVLLSMKFTDVLLMCLERAIYFAMHIFLSIIVFYSVKRQTIQYFWIAVVLRGLGTIPGSIETFCNFPTGSAASWLLLLATIATCVLTGYIAVKLYKNYDTERVLLPSQLFKKNSTDMKMY